MSAIRMSDLVDERGSIDVSRVDWQQTPHGLAATVNRSVLEARMSRSGGPSPTWNAYIGGEFQGYSADNDKDVLAYLLGRAAFQD